MKKNKKAIMILGKIISFILLVCFILFTYTLIKLDVLPIKFLTIVLVVFGILVLKNIFILCTVKFKKKLKITNIIFSIIKIAIFILGFIYLNNTYNFIDNLKQVNYITEEYYVLVNNESNYKDINDIAGKEIYTFNEQIEIYNMALDKLNKVSNTGIKESSSIQSMCQELMDNEIDAVMLSSIHKVTVDEELEGFKNSVKAIYTIKVKYEKKDTAIAHPDINVSQQPFVVYISGSDSYGNISARSRSDVNMLVTVNPIAHEVLLTSIPRDYYVQLHNTSGYKDKLTHAGMYGIDMSVNTISDFLDINIDYYFKVNFSTLVKLVDAIGNVDVYSDRQFVPWTNDKLLIKKGFNNMNGEMAIAFARERKTYREGDRHRIQNQQDVLSAIVKKVSTSTVLLTRYLTILNNLSSTFDTNFTKVDITGLAKLQIDDMPDWTIKTYNLNGTDSNDYTYSCGNQKLYVMIPDEKTIDNANKYIIGMRKGKTFSELGIN